ncbi:PLP-dependent transferase [Nadsonia fulvescens var. elongata DSM 6958]|uniref:Acetylornithine aminotransferase, mitochondrial n=1 Tax=Nadsonia fulvescens var. elongata DSM 6958 TaxID=857566 RepID=A0A1E3PLB0_9ASCO|nr:PLP-dependent transferase [Nadsonia fulvescens var. elongata DSM 6958]
MVTDSVVEPSLLHRSLHEKPILVDSAKGSYLYLSNEKRIIDGCGGAAVVSVGHSNEQVIADIHKQLQTVSYVHTLVYSTSPSEELANLILEGNPGGLCRAFFCSSGSEANESALKLSRQYFYEKGETQRVNYISRNLSFHGNCLGGMSLSGHVARRRPFEDIIPDNFHRVSAANSYRGKKEGESDEIYVSRLALELDAKFQELGSDTIIGFVAEPIVGASLGSMTAPGGYFKAMREVCDKYGALLIFDEVMCGSGRTGTFFAWEQENVVPDIVSIGKALGGGYGPVAGILIHQKIVNVLKKNSGCFNSGHTYQAHPISCAGALSVQKIIKKQNLLENVRKMGAKLGQMLHLELDDHPYVGDIRGRGLFWGIEFVNDKQTKEPFDPSLSFGNKVKDAIFNLGCAVYPGCGTVDGVKGDHILISPSFDITGEMIEEIVSIVKQGIVEASKSITN